MIENSNFYFDDKFLKQKTKKKAREASLISSDGEENKES